MVGIREAAEWIRPGISPKLNRNFTAVEGISGYSHYQKQTREKDMLHKDLILTLAKVVIAAAWADDKITLSERESLKDLMFRLPHVDAEAPIALAASDWNQLEMMIEAPITAEQRQQVINDLKSHLDTAEDKKAIMTALAHLVRADETLTDEELQMAEMVEQAIAEVDVGLVARLGRLVRRRMTAVTRKPDNEAAFADYLKNRVYHGVRRRLNLEQGALDISEADLRKLSLAGGLMAQVAYVDRVVTETEFAQIVEALQLYWEVSEATAVFITEVATAEVSADLDYYRITREFFDHTNEAERIQFLDVLFAIAAADGGVSHQESENIRRISVSLNLVQRQFMTAKRKFV